MSACFQIEVVPATATHIYSDGSQSAYEPENWFFFPDEVAQWLEKVLLPFGYEPGSGVDANALLLQIEYMFRGDEAIPFPWAIVFFPQEYALAGHLMSIRPNLEVRFNCYSLIWPQDFEKFDPAINGPPKVSIIFLFSKSALQIAASTGSSLLSDAWRDLADKAEDSRWVVIADSLDPYWVQHTSEASDDLFFSLTGNLRRIS